MGSRYLEVADLISPQDRLLLDHALRSREQFESSTVGNGYTARHDETRGVSLMLRELGEYCALFEQAVLARVFREPKAFAAGELRLLALQGATGAEEIIVPPAQGVAVAFPSWLPHEVLPIECPSKEFADSRFAVNCWVTRQRPGYPE